MKLLQLTLKEERINGHLAEYTNLQTGEYLREDGEGYLEVLQKDGQWFRKYKKVCKPIYDDGGDITGYETLDYEEI